MTHTIAASGIGVIAEPSLPPNGKPVGNGGPVAETGTVIARIFDLLEGTRFEPFAAQVAWGLVNGARRQPQH